MLKEKFAIIAYDAYSVSHPIKKFDCLDDAGAELKRMLEAREWSHGLKYFHYRPQETGPNFSRDRAEKEKQELLRQYGGERFEDLVYLDGYAESYTFRLTNTPSHIIQMWEF